MVSRILPGMALVLLSAMPGLAGPVPVPPLQPHRAVYDLELADATERSGVDALYGRMVFEFTGAACKGYTTRFRFATRITAADVTRLSDQQMTSFEDNKTFRFDNKALTDEKLDKEVKGEATLTPEGVAVELSGPEARSLKLPPGLFPSAHLREVISQALNGVPLFDAHLFDGSENADKRLLVTTIIGKPETGVDAQSSEGKAAEPLAGKPWWPVTASYFDDSASGDAEPSYRMSFKLYDNGIGRDFVMDYGDFSISGKLATLELLPEERCEAPKTP